MKLFNFGKYRAIVLSIGAFVLLIAGVMVLNVFISSQLAKDAVQINVAGRQRALSQRTVKNLLDVQNTARDGGPIDYPLSELTKTTQLFGITLQALRDGGMTTGSDGRPVTLEKVEATTGRLMLEEAFKLWLPYQNLLNAIVTDKPKDAWFMNLAKATDYSQRNNVALLELMHTLATGMQTTVGASGGRLVSQQGMLSQRIAKDLLTLKETAITGGDISGHLKALQHIVTLFDTTLTALQAGEPIKESDDQLVAPGLDASPASQQALATAVRLWAPYTSLLNNIFTGAPEATWLQQLAESITYGREHNLSLFKLMNDLTTELEQGMISKVNRLQYMQVAAITLALLYFFVILFRFVRQLRHSDAMAEQARQETHDIVHTVQEGLFLLNPDLRIGSQFSAATRALFAKAALEGTTLQDLLGGMVTAKDMQLTTDYVSLLFGGRVNEKLVRNINPLSQVAVNVDQRDGHFDIKHFAFNFNRVMIDQKLSHLLVTVHDVSERVQLQKALEEARENSQDQLNMLLNILHVERRTMGQFLTDTAAALHNINDIFRQNRIDASNARRYIDAIFRIIHQVKGEAAALGLPSFETRAHAFEDVLTALREQAGISGNHFLPLTVKLDELMQHQAAVQSLVQRFHALPALEATAPAAAEPAPWNHLHHLIQRIAETEGKRVALHTEGLETAMIPHEY